MECLAVSAAPIQGRLTNAGLSALSRLEPNDFDDLDAKQRYGSIMTALTSREPSGSRGAIQASAEALSDEEAVELARQISELHALVLPLG